MCASKYYLSNDGDKVEQRAWPLFGKQKFPNYEIFWQLFVVPRTNRDVDRADIHPKDDISDLDCELMSMHWQILYNFDFIYRHMEEIKGNNEKACELFEHSFIKLSNTCDLVEELVYKLLVYLEKLNQTKISIPEIDKKKIKTTEEIFSELNKKGTYSIPIEKRINLIKKCVDKDLWSSFSKYLKIAELIRKYRNPIVHSWQSFYVNGKVPNPSYVKDAKTWVKITRIIKSKNEKKKQELVKNHYVEKDKLILAETNKLINCLNELWEEIIKVLPKPESETRELIYEFIGGLSASTDGSIPITYTVPSGTAWVRLTSNPPASGSDQVNFSAGLRIDEENSSR